MCVRVEDADDAEDAEDAEDAATAFVGAGAGEGAEPAAVLEYSTCITCTPMRQPRATSQSY